MFRALIKKDFRLLRFRARSFVMLVLLIVVLMGVIAISPQGSGVAILGTDFVRLMLLSLIVLGAFLEHYTGSLATDKRNGIFSLIMISGMSRVAYFAAKAVIPALIAFIAGIVSFLAFVTFTHPAGLPNPSLRTYLVIASAEIFLSMGLGMLLNALTSVDIKENPSIVLPLILVNMPVLYFANPLHHFWVFVVITISLGLVAYAICIIVINARYHNNLAPRLP